MGFFSRFFKFKEQDSSSPETTWAYEDNASELCWIRNTLPP